MFTCSIILFSAYGIIYHNYSLKSGDKKWTKWNKIKSSEQLISYSHIIKWSKENDWEYKINAENHCTFCKRLKFKTVLQLWNVTGALTALSWSCLPSFDAHVKGLMQKRCNSSANALDLYLFCIKQLIWRFQHAMSWLFFISYHSDVLLLTEWKPRSLCT